MHFDKDTNLVWMDLEMTGLDPDVDRILEIGILVTNENLEILDAGFEVVIHQSEEELSKMDSHVREMVNKNGLLERVNISKISEEDAENMVLDYIKKFVNEKKSPLCGNSIWKDKSFIYKYMKDLSNYLHYRIIDVSSIRELSKRWYPQVPKAVDRETHRSLTDIEDSINELKHFRKEIFKPVIV